MNSPSTNVFRQLPSVDSLLQAMPELVAQWGHSAVATTVRDTIQSARTAMQKENAALPTTESLCEQVANALAQSANATLKPVLNLTGTVLHTNLGRAVLPPEALEAIVTVAGAASNLEYDLEAGERGDRETHIEALVCELTGAEAATAVNNNAAAVLLVLNTLALGKAVPVSRGELVEIGGSFRIPEVMQRSGCTLVEIGATNRTHEKDYRNAITQDTALIMKVHTSNYQVEGFTESVAEPVLAALAKEHDLPYVVDLGSGNLIDFGALGLPDEPTAASAIANGADIITFSGDKLLGGPQAGIIAGRADLIAQIKRNPLKRALRLDKMTLAGLAEVLKLYRNPQALVSRLPTLRMLTREVTDIEAQCTALLPQAVEVLGAQFCVTVEACHSQIGSGSLPVDTLPSAALRIAPAADDEMPVRQLAEALRATPVPVVARMHKGALWLDFRCLGEHEGERLIDQLRSARIAFA
ncbi:MAG: L-seryl-tRNA(Sec) selenium transferase [Halioglobus sp.]